jgi:hypothetical protein
MLSHVVNNLCTIVQNRLQQCCAAPRQQGLLTILFTLVRTMLFTPDEWTRPEQRCRNNWDQPDINDALYCQQLRTVLFYQYVNSLVSIVFDAVIRGHFPGGKGNLNKHTNRQTSLLDMKFSLFWNKKIQISEQIQTKELITVKVQR